MPYIRDKKRRAEMDLIVELMDQYKVEANGDLNYILFKYCKIREIFFNTSFVRPQHKGDELCKSQIECH